MRLSLPALIASLCIAACGSGPDLVQPNPGDAVQVAEADVEEVAASTDRIGGRSSRDLATILVERELEREHAMRYLRELTREAPGRAAGSAAYERAVKWSERTMAQIGLVDIHREPVVINAWDRGLAEHARLIGADGAEQELRILAMSGSVPTDDTDRRGSLTARVVRIATYDDLADRSVVIKGKVVFVDEGLSATAGDPCAAFRELEARMAAAASDVVRRGAVAVLLRSPTYTNDDVPRCVAVRYSGRRIPAATLSPNSADVLVAALREDSEAKVELSIHSSRRAESIIASSVFGEIRGTVRPDEIVLIAARLDSSDVGEGAHDDGAGVAQALAAARSILTTGVRPERTIRIALLVHGGREQRGARAYVRDHADELGRHIAAIAALRGGYSPRGFALAATEAAQLRLGNSRGLIDRLDPFGASRFEQCEPAASVLPPFALSRVPVFDLITDSQRAVDLERSELDTFETVVSRHLAIGSASIAYLSVALASDVEP